MKEIYSMSNVQKTKINEMIATFVTQLTAEIETNASSILRNKLAGVMGDLPEARHSVSVGRKAKRNYHRKQCPFPGCTELGAPRYSQFCIAHGKELQAKGKSEFAKLKATYQAEASKPGGVWYVETSAGKRARKVAA